jgi:hypothetical protein
LRRAGNSEDCEPNLAVQKERIQFHEITSAAGRSEEEKKFSSNFQKFEFNLFFAELDAETSNETTRVCKGGF